ncbi:MAG: TMEM165/GDT1 family protein [Hyphomonadaceae bacterium]
MSQFLPIFFAVFLAELGDKTQLAALLFSSEGKTPPLLVFCAAGAALLASTAIAVFAGAMAREWVSGLPLKLIAGLGFLAIGAWTLVEHFRAAA